MIDGTSLFQLPDLLAILDATEVSTAHARILLAGGDQFISDLAGATHPALHEPAWRLLTRLSGRDYKFDPERWREWARSL